MAFSPRGAVLVRAWRALVDVPLIAIGGINLETAPEVNEPSVFLCFCFCFIPGVGTGSRYIPIHITSSSIVL